MSAICSHTDSITVTELPDEIAGCADCLAIGGTLGAPAHVPSPAASIGCCDSSPNRHATAHAGELRPPDHPLRRARRGLELVLPRQRRVRGRRAMTLPELHLADWRPTKDTLHLYAQIVGKIRLATTPHRATTGGTSRSTSTSAGSRHGACIIATRPSRSRSTSSITPWSCGPLTVAPGRSSSATECPSRTSTPDSTRCSPNSASTSRSRSSRSASR